MSANFWKTVKTLNVCKPNTSDIPAQLKYVNALNIYNVNALPTLNAKNDSLSQCLKSNCAAFAKFNFRCYKISDDSVVSDALE